MRIKFPHLFGFLLVALIPLIFYSGHTSIKPTEWRFLGIFESKIPTELREVIATSEIVSVVGCNDRILNLLKETAQEYTVRIFEDCSNIKEDEIKTIGESDTVFIEISRFVHLDIKKAKQKTKQRTLKDLGIFLEMVAHTFQIVIFKRDILSSHFETELEMESVAEAIEQFLEYNVRWSVVMEPYSLEERHHIFILKGDQNPIFHGLQRNQFPQNCSAVKFATAPFWPYGFGSLLQVTKPGLQVSWVTNRTLVLFGEWNTYAHQCSSKREDCYFYRLQIFSDSFRF
jgi:hypothetical protein